MNAFDFPPHCARIQSERVVVVFFFLALHENNSMNETTQMAFAVAVPFVKVSYLNDQYGAKLMEIIEYCLGFCLCAFVTAVAAIIANENEIAYVVSTTCLFFIHPRSNALAGKLQ